MKRLGNIFDKICTMENLREAHENARKGKRKYGGVKMVDRDPEKYLKQIQDMLVNKTYEVSPYTIKDLFDGGKPRILMKLPYYPDRIIQWAIMLQIRHVFMSVFVHHTCASVRGRGIHQATKLMNEYMRDKEKSQYCLKIDVAKFYPSINHEILKSLLRRKFKDPDLLELLDKIIDSLDAFPSSPQSGRPGMPDAQGIPIGSYLSQYLANYYLSYFDHWLKETQGAKYVVRYMDDIVILSDSKEWLHALKCKIDDYLTENLKLRLKDNWQVFPTGVRGVDFVGYRHFYGFKLLRKSSAKRFKRKMSSIRKKTAARKPINYHDFCAYNSYIGWLKWCDSFRLIQKHADPLANVIQTYYENKIRKESA